MIFTIISAVAQLEPDLIARGYGGVEYTVEPDNGIFQNRHFENGKNIDTNCGTDVEKAIARLISEDS